MLVKNMRAATGGQDAGSELDLLSTFAGTHDATEWCYSGQLAQHTQRHLRNDRGALPLGLRLCGWRITTSRPPVLVSNALSFPQRRRG